MNPLAASARQPLLRRALGRWDLTAIGVNQIIGGGIFLMPAPIVALIGNWSPWAFLLAGFASFCVGLCFAEAGSRFSTTGGPYLYTRVAFGSFVAFETGWMQWFTRVSSQATIVNGIAASLGFYWPEFREGWERVFLIVGVTLGFGVLNTRGIRQTAWAINGFTAGKLIPLIVFAGVGMFYVDWRKFAPLPAVGWDQAAGAGLLLFFTFGGYDTIVVPGGESRAPRRDLVFALTAAIALSAAVMLAVQVVTMGTIDEVGSRAAPVAEAAALFLGKWGAALVVVGSVVSMLGNSLGGALAASRLLFAMGENGDVPRVFSRVHPQFGTPWVAIWFSTFVALVLALTGSFAWLAATSALARLATYLSAAAATLALRRPEFSGRVDAALYRTPFGPLVPLLAIVSSCAMFAGASSEQLLAGLAAVAVGAVLYGARRVA